jgi:hypothetical protein
VSSQIAAALTSFLSELKQGERIWDSFAPQSEAAIYF